MVSAVEGGRLSATDQLERLALPPGCPADRGRNVADTCTKSRHTQFGLDAEPSRARPNSGKINTNSGVYRSGVLFQDGLEREGNVTAPNGWCKPRLRRRNPQRRYARLSNRPDSIRQPENESTGAL
jgi:hypothetical protein